MTIKNAKQNGNRVVISYDNFSTSVQGELIGYTPNAVFVKNGRNLYVFKQKNGSFGGCGSTIIINPSEEVKMYGNCVGIKRTGATTAKLYDENGKPAGIKSV